MNNDLRYLKRRLAAARKRAAYWSGRPSGPGRGHAGGERDPDFEYELAMDDCNALAD